MEKKLGRYAKCNFKNFVREIIRAFQKRICAMLNLKISLTRNVSLTTVSNDLIFLLKLFKLKISRGSTVGKHITCRLQDQSI